MCEDLRITMGWDGAKAGHNLLKASTDAIFQTYGIDLAEAFSGDTASVLRRSYIGKKIIPNDIKSIAKL